MQTEEQLAAPPPPVVPPPSAPSVHLRVRQGMRRPHNWLQLFKFCLVGGSGYVVNLAVFTAGVWGLGLHHLIAATLAFVVAVANNFWWNRHWTFGAKGGRARFQAPRFFAVSVLAFLVQAALLDALIVMVGMSELLAQAVSVAAATPLNFVGNKMWSFAAGRSAA
jgi:dolichol-phosphate mannosyltransferase